MIFKSVLRRLGFVIGFISFFGISTMYSQDMPINDSKINYFNERYQPINKKDFDSLRWSKGLLMVQGDSTHHRILSLREGRGTLSNKKLFNSTIAKASQRKIDSLETIVIIYYPGKDDCNSSGNATTGYRKRWYKKLEKELFKITRNKPFYFYKVSRPEIAIH